MNMKASVAPTLTSFIVSPKVDRFGVTRACSVRTGK